MVRSRFVLLALGLVLVSVGCGGDGSSFNNNSLTSQNSVNNPVNNGPSSGDLALYFTGNVSEQYEHVWVSVKKVDLKLAAGGFRTIFEDNRGLGMDVASLHGESGPSYRFVSGLNLPAGTYVGAKLTFASESLVFPLKATSGKTLGFAKQAADAKDAIVDVSFDPPKMLGTGHDDLVLDFDLSKWKESDGGLTLAINSSLGAGLEDADRNSPTIETGTIENLKGEVPGQTFYLKSSKSLEISVSTSAKTALMTEADSDGPMLAK